MAWLYQNWWYVLLFVGVLFFLMRRGGGMGCGPVGHSTSHGGHHHGQESGSFVDPVSGQEVHADSPVASMHKGHLYRFASRENRERFESDPERYVYGRPPQSASHRHGGHGGCC